MQIKEVIDKDLWNNCLVTFPYTTLFLSWAWTEYEKLIGSKFETWGIFDDAAQEEHLVGILPINIVRAKRGKYLHLRHAPLIDWENKGVVQTVVKFLKDKAKKEKVDFIRISPLLKNTLDNQLNLQRLGFRKALTHARDAELTVIIDLKKSTDQILAEMRKNTRNLIHKAEKIGVTVANTNIPESFEEFEKVYQDTVQRQKWTAYAPAHIKKEFEIFAKEGKAYMFTARYNNETISAAIFIVQQNQVIYHHSGSLTKYRDIPAAYLLHWEAIKYFKNLGLEIYNFWGVSPQENRKHPWHGLSLFKRGFTHTELEFLHAHDLIITPLAHLTRVYEYMEAWGRGYK